METFLEQISLLFFIYVGIGVAAFFIFRELVLWYWKVDKIIDLLERIEKNTRQPVTEKEKNQVGQTAEKVQLKPESPQNYLYCSNCKKKINTNMKISNCYTCGRDLVPYRGQ